MTKTTTANIGGLTFSIEEEAYSRLKNYLDAIRTSLSSTSYGDEVLSDIEARAAELFQKKAPNQVVTSTDVESLITEIGTPEDVAGDDIKTNNTQPNPKRQRRLYRNPDDMIIAGVASGIAAYFGIDPLWIRLGFIIASLIGASGILIYLVLWLIVPVAETSTEKLEMRGDPITLERMEQMVKERVKEAKADETIRRNGSALGSFLRDLVSHLGHAVQTILKMVLSIFGAVITIGSILWLVAITIILVILAFGGNNSYIEFPLQDAFQGPAYAGLLAAGYLTFLLPLIAAISLGAATVRRNWQPLAAQFLVLGILWVGAVISVAALVSSHLPQIHAIQQEAQLQSSKTIEITNNFSIIQASNDIKVRISQGTTPSITVSSDARNIESLKTSINNSTLSLSRQQTEEWPICIFCNQHGLTVDIIVSELTSVKAQDATLITIDDFTSNNLTLISQDVSRITFEGTAQNLTASSSDISRIKLQGSSPSLTATSSDASNINADDFNADIVNATTHDMSHIIVRPIISLEATANDISRITYFGNPEIQQSEFSNGQVEPGY